MKVNIHELKNKDPVAYALLKASWLQKAIRRGMTETALGIAELYKNDNQWEGLKRRLWVFACEDIGLGTPEILLLMNQYKDDPVNQIKILCQCPKNRECDRFLLQVANNYDNYKNNKQLQHETLPLNQIFSISSSWFENKRDKAALNKLKQAFEILKENRPEEWVKHSLDLAIEQYIILSKHKIFGTRTLLAFSVLLATRTTIDKINFQYNDTELKPATLSIVDDFALDKHTSFGKLLNRGVEFWLKEGIVIFPERIYPEQFYNGNEKYPY